MTASERFRKTLVISGTVYAASAPLMAAFIWLTSRLGIMPGIERAGTMDVIADACLVIGFMALATLAVCSWLVTTACSDEGIFYPFIWSAWLAHFGLDKRAIGPFAFHGNPPSFSAPQGFYLSMTIAAVVRS